MSKDGTLWYIKKEDNEGLLDNIIDTNTVYIAKYKDKSYSIKPTTILFQNKNLGHFIVRGTQK